MDRYEHVVRLLDYDDWANREFLGALQAHPTPEGVRLFAHVVAAQVLWLDRMAHRPMTCPVWPDWSIDECAVRLDVLRANWRSFLRGLDARALSTSISYVNTKGQHFKNQIGDVISHVLFHASYHRGQLAQTLRAAGHEAPYTDFIHAVREGTFDAGGD
jgi:uncharacterized damage-inducible protein DinB